MGNLTNKFHSADEIDAVVRELHNRLGVRVKKSITPDLIRNIWISLGLSQARMLDPAPRLVVRRLFISSRELKPRSKNGSATGVSYDQTFVSGVNVVLVERNSAGKSTVLKAVKFALTGDFDEFDLPVKHWIREVRLEFLLGEDVYCSVLWFADGKWSGVLLRGGMGEARAEDISTNSEQIVGSWNDLGEIQRGLEDFFLKKYQLQKMVFTTKVAAEDKSRRNHISWTSYFRALRIKDDDHTYLFFEPLPGLAQQESLLLSSYLGLAYASALNELQVVGATGEVVSQKQLDAEAREDATEQRLAGEANALEDQIQRDLTVVSECVNAFSEIAHAECEISAVIRQEKELEDRIRDLESQIDAARSIARKSEMTKGMRAQLAGHPLLCPCCLRDVPSRDGPGCDMCGQPIVPQSDNFHDDHETSASVDSDIAEMSREHDILRNQAVEVAQRRTNLEARLAGHRSRAACRVDISQLGNNVTELLRKKQELLVAQARVKDRRSNLKSIAVDDVKKIRDALSEFADSLNHDVYALFGSTVVSNLKRIGVTAISAVNVSSVGRVSMNKDGAAIGWREIKNPGERFRVKFAVFLAVALLRATCVNVRHPGFFLIDQPGGNEITDPVLDELAGALREIDRTYGSSVQIICATARERLRASTSPEKVYGGQYVDEEGLSWMF